MIPIVCLILGIVGFVKGKISVTKHKELRGSGLYLVATLMCLPLPLSFLAGVLLALMAAGNGVDESTVTMVGVIAGWTPLIAAFILAFALSKPKLVAPPPVTANRGFEVTMKQ